VTPSKLSKSKKNKQVKLEPQPEVLAEEQKELEKQIAMDLKLLSKVLKARDPKSEDVEFRVIQIKKGEKLPRTFFNKPTFSTAQQSLSQQTNVTVKGSLN